MGSFFRIQPKKKYKKIFYICTCHENKKNRMNQIFLTKKTKFYDKARCYALICHV